MCESTELDQEVRYPFLLLLNYNFKFKRKENGEALLYLYSFIIWRVNVPNGPMVGVDVRSGQGHASLDSLLHKE